MVSGIKICSKLQNQKFEFLIIAIELPISTIIGWYQQFK